MKFPRFDLDLFTVIPTFGDCPCQQVSDTFCLSAICLLLVLELCISAMYFLLSLNLATQPIHAYKTSYISHQNVWKKFPSSIRFMWLILISLKGVIKKFSHMYLTSYENIINAYFTVIIIAFLKAVTNYIPG